MTTIRSLSVAAAAVIMLALAACGPTLDQETYDKLAVGMTQPQVEDILGGPGEEQSGGYEISSGGVLGSNDNRNATTTTYIWKSSSGAQEVTVTFKEGKVIGMAKAGF